VSIPDRLAISDDELRPYGPTATLGQRAAALLAQQRDSWELARKGYGGLDAVQVRAFRLDGYPFLLQHNPARMTSSTARVDDASIRNRRCFLCSAHLPEGQRALPVEGDWLLLVNPFPIFPSHFTVANAAHVPQRIVGNLGPMLRIIRSLGPEYTLFYNGPRSGASAPDHMHFQVGSRGFMPIDQAAPSLIQRHGRALSGGGPVHQHVVVGLLRPFAAFESRDLGALVEAIERLIARLPREDASPEEPMLNLIVRWEEGWRVLLYPRVRHRPAFFFAEDPDKILISPAAVDMGGVSIAPRHEDFVKISGDLLERMFREVCPDASVFDSVADQRL